MKTVDKIIKKFTALTTQLEALAMQKDDEVEHLTKSIEGMRQVRGAATLEARRAREISGRITALIA